MSPSHEPAQEPLQEQAQEVAPSTQGSPGRYQRSSGGLLGATIVTVLAVLAFVGYRSLWRDNPATPVQTVDYRISLQAARHAHQLQAMAPASLPRGWKATSASYTTTPGPAWHLGALTASGQYVGIEEQQASLDTLVSKYVDANASRGADVRLGGVTYQSYTDAGGDYALGRTVRRGDSSESYLVVGTAPDARIRSFTASLHGGPGSR